nr:hypothetical protein [Tanacetum cinerariifolium]
VDQHHAGHGEVNPPVVLEHDQHHHGADQHGDSCADFRAACDELAVTPVAQHGAEQAVIFQPGAQTR